MVCFISGTVQVMGSVMDFVWPTPVKPRPTSRLTYPPETILQYPENLFPAPAQPVLEAYLRSTEYSVQYTELNGVWQGVLCRQMLLMHNLSISRYGVGIY